jgi:ABC-type polar amino acid transport system ATPase subunit
MVGEVLSLMKDLAKEGMTMIVVTHEIAFACEVANRMVFMDHGKILAVGTPEDLVEKSDNQRIKDFFGKVL